MPVGTILSWVMKVDKNGGHYSELPPGWMYCDGSEIQAPSEWAGKRVPDLNGERRFLRGGPEENVLNLEDHQMQDHAHGIDHTITLHDPGHHHSYRKVPEEETKVSGGLVGNEVYDWHGPSNYDTTDISTGITVSSSVDGLGIKGDNGFNYGDETRPKNMNVMFIIRVW